jgi:alkylation response protein AidB-like acyl-CoA dehydrogenase
MATLVWFSQPVFNDRTICDHSLPGGRRRKIVEPCMLPHGFRGSTQPVGTAEATADDWRVNGSWPFASGCQHADWMFGFCVMTEGGKPLPGPAGEGGPPLVRGFFLPARDWQIEDTWYVAGLKGTGSHHITLRGKVVSAANFFDLETAYRACRDRSTKPCCNSFR